MPMKSYPTESSELAQLLYDRIANLEDGNPIPKKYLQAALELDTQTILLSEEHYETLLLSPTLADFRAMKKAFGCFEVRQEGDQNGNHSGEMSLLDALHRYTTGEQSSSTEYGFYLILQSVLSGLATRFEDALNQNFFFDHYESSFIILVHMAASPFLYRSERGDVLFELLEEAIMREAYVRDVSPEDKTLFFLNDVLKFADKMKDFQA